MKKSIIVAGVLIIVASIGFSVWYALQPHTPEDFYDLLKKNKGAIAPGDKTALEALAEEYRKTRVLFEEKFPDSELIDDVAFERIELVDKQIGDVTAAFDLYKEFVSDFEKSELAAEAWYRMGEILLEQEKYLASVEAFRDVVIRFPEHELADDAQYQIGMIFVEIGEDSVAMKELKAVTEKFPDSPFAPKAQLKMADLLSEKMEQRREAVSQLRQLQEKYPGTAEARAAEGMEKVLGEEEAARESEDYEEERYGAPMVDHTLAWQKQLDDTLTEEIVRQGHDLLHHELEVTILPEERAMQLRALVELRSGTEELSRLLFRLGAPATIQTIYRLDSTEMPESMIPTSEMIAPLDFSHDGAALLCRFPEKLKPGEELSLYLVYEFDGNHPELQPAGAIGEGSGFLHVQSGWYPMTTFSDSSTSRTVFRIEEPYTVVGCGALENEKTLEGATGEFTWTASVPYIGQSMAYGDYTVENREVTIAGQTFPIRVYALEGNEGGAKAVLDETEWIIQYYSETFCPYPYEELKLAETPNFPGGFGACTLICLHSPAFDDPLPRWLLAHELSHQWWGHVVGPASREGGIPWLNEGFATYSDILYQEQIGSPNELRRHLFNYAVKFYEQAAYVADDPIRTIDWTSPMYQAVTYHKGALILHTLRFVMGDEAFFRALQEYVTSHRFDFVTVADFRQVCEKYYEPSPASPGFEPEEGQGSLEWFFEEWMDRPGFPILRLADVGVDPSGMKNQLEFSILQEEYVYHLPVEIRISGAQEEKWERVWVGMPNDYFEYELDWTPRKIELDPNFWIFKDPKPSFTIWKIQE